MDTNLITRKQAEKLRAENYERCKRLLEEWEEPQMCIRIDCESSWDYHTKFKEIDYRGCKVLWGKVYWLAPTEIL